MKNDVLNSLLHIHINGLEQFTPECDKFIRTTDCEEVENSEGQKESTKEEEVRSKYPTRGCLCQLCRNANGERYTLPVHCDS